MPKIVVNFGKNEHDTTLYRVVMGGCKINNTSPSIEIKDIINDYIILYLEDIERKEV